MYCNASEAYSRLIVAIRSSKPCSTRPSLQDHLETYEVLKVSEEICMNRDLFPLTYRR